MLNDLFPVNPMDRLVRVRVMVRGRVRNGKSIRFFTHDVFVLLLSLSPHSSDRLFPDHNFRIFLAIFADRQYFLSAKRALMIRVSAQSVHRES